MFSGYFMPVLLYTSTAAPTTPPKNKLPNRATLGMGMADTVKDGTYWPRQVISKLLISLTTLIVPGVESVQRPLSFCKWQVAIKVLGPHMRRTFTSWESSLTRLAHPLRRQMRPTAKACLGSLKSLCVGITMAGFLKCLKCFALVVNRLEAVYLEHLRRQFSDKSPILELSEASFKPSKSGNVLPQP